MERIIAWHPRRHAIGAALSRAFPIAREDREAREERRLLRRVEIGEAMKG